MEVKRSWAARRVPVILAKSHPFVVGLLVIFPPLITALLQLLFWSYLQPYAWILFYPGIFLSSFFGGVKGGLISTTLAAVLVVYLFLPPQFAFLVLNPWTLVPIAVFMATGMLFSLVHEHLRKATQEANSAMLAVQEANDQLEVQVRQRTAELLQSNSSLRVSEARLNTIVENLGEGVVVADMTGQLLHFNLSAITMFGFNSREENAQAVPVFAETFEFLTLDGNVVPRSEWPLARILRGETLHDLEIRVRNLKTDWQRVLSYRGSLVLDAAGVPMMAVITMRDITERKQSEIRFRALIENSADGISLIDAKSKIIYLTPGVTAIEGYAEEELLNRSCIEHTHLDDVAKIRQVIEQLLIAPGKPVPMLWRRRHKSGSWLWLEGVATNLLAEPAVKAIVINYRNVTSRIQHEEKIRVQLEHLRLLDHITRAVAERQDLVSIFQVAVRSLEEGLPIDFGCVMIYDPVAKMLRVTSVGSKSAELTHGLVLEEQAVIDIDKNGMESCMQGRLVYEPDIGKLDYPFPARLASGGLGSIVMAPLRSESHVFGMLVAGRKVKEGFMSSECEFLRQLSEHIGLASRQTQLNIALQQAYDDLRQSQEVMMEEERLRALGQMASGIAHDINNALTPVLLYAETILETEDNLGEESRGYLETIKRSVEDVAQTVARLREFYRQRDDELKLAPVQMNEIVEQIVDLTRARWSDMPQQRGIVIRVKTQLDPDFPKVWGVESEMREALTNLVFNAVDAMPDGGVMVLRTRVARVADTELAYVEVADDGIGMDEDTRKRCLEPFFTTKGERGTGLGLAMVFGIVQRHGAGFEIESTPGAGTTMRLIFAVPPEALQENTPIAIVNKAPAPLRILVIDDDPILLRSLRSALEIDGHFVITEDSGEAGITTFCALIERKEPVDVVITDLGMPYMDGRQIAMMVKQVSATPVILLTGWGQRLISEGDIPLHVDKVLAKPPRLLELRKTLAQLCPEPVAVQHQAGG